jgi:poly-gamma-glutamate biosynthesis protein PgsC/CapC
MILQVFIIGLVIGFIFYEITGISPGGVIAPAYFALFINEPDRIIVTIIIALIICYLIRFLSANLIIYGRRRLLLAVVFSLFLKLLFDTVIQPVDIIKFDMQSIGYIIPGLIANDLSRQKVLPTLLSLGSVALIIFQISLLVS